jgi:hypothetical protein
MEINPVKYRLYLVAEHTAITLNLLAKLLKEWELLFFDILHDTAFLSKMKVCPNQKR